MLGVLSSDCSHDSFSIHYFNWDWKWQDVTQYFHSNISKISLCKINMNLKLLSFEFRKNHEANEHNNTENTYDQPQNTLKIKIWFESWIPKMIFAYLKTFQTKKVKVAILNNSSFFQYNKNSVIRTKNWNNIIENNQNLN